MLLLLCCCYCCCASLISVVVFIARTIHINTDDAPQTLENIAQDLFQAKILPVLVTICTYVSSAVPFWILQLVMCGFGVCAIIYATVLMARRVQSYNAMNNKNHKEYPYNNNHHSRPTP